MANSSDWIAALGEEAAAREPAGWVAALDARADFRPGAPFAARPAPPPGPSPQEELAAALAAARAEGEAAGRAAARAESEAGEEHRRALRLAFRSLDAAAMDALCADLAETVIALCEEAIGGWTPDSEGLAERCREAARRLGGAPGAFALHLNPADIEALGPEDLEGWRIEPDPALERGALRLEGADGTLADGPEQWRRAIAEAVRG
ncbi:MAG: hypothetical protein RIB52_08940 [Erythrobacter sp.]|uniref:FliH/SctL family protein n=1 Tax=Erythrobacter sp. TaxID=1042 RepID=UPI0032EFADBC